MNKARKVRPITAIFSAGLGLALVAACSTTSVDSNLLQGDAPLITNVSANPDAQAGVISASTQLGLDLIDQTEGENAVTSPASAVIALAMLAATGDGESEAELAAVLGAQGQERDEAVNALSQALARYAGDVAKLDVEDPPEEPLVHLANQVVIRPDLDVSDTYLDALSSWYDAGVLSLDLADPDSKEVLDEWVRTNTAGLIEESALEPNPDLVMALQNATLFAAQWAKTFKAESTHERDFTPLNGGVEPVDFMADTRAARFAQIDGWAFLELPYGGDGELAAQFFLPPEGVDPAQADPQLLADLEAAADSQMVAIRLPILDIESKINMIPLLEARGVTQIFDPQAGALSHINDERDLFVSAVIQQGRMVQHEKGTVAAAVTEIAVEASSANVEPPVEFFADRPHLVVLKDLSTDWDLFHVAVRNPNTLQE